MDSPKSNNSNSSVASSSAVNSSRNKLDLRGIKMFRVLVKKVNFKVTVDKQTSCRQQQLRDKVDRRRTNSDDEFRSSEDDDDDEDDDSEADGCDGKTISKKSKTAVDCLAKVFLSLSTSSSSSSSNEGGNTSISSTTSNDSNKSIASGSTDFSNNSGSCSGENYYSSDSGFRNGKNNNKSPVRRPIEVYSKTYSSNKDKKLITTDTNTTITTSSCCRSSSSNSNVTGGNVSGNGKNSPLSPLERKTKRSSTSSKSILRPPVIYTYVRGMSGIPTIRVPLKQAPMY